jgi:hypothetical protein
MPPNGLVIIVLPKEFIAVDWEDIALLQDKTTGEIYPADKVRVKDKAITVFP